MLKRLLNNITGIERHLMYLMFFFQLFLFKLLNLYFLSDIILKEEFYSLNVDQLINIISKDHISVDSEMVILKSVIRWMNSDKENRYKDLATIMRHVRLPLMEKEELHELLSVSLFRENEKILDIIKEAIDLQLSPQATGENSCQLDLAFIRPRIPLGLPKVRN